MFLINDNNNDDFHCYYFVKLETSVRDDVTRASRPFRTDPSPHCERCGLSAGETKGIRDTGGEGGAETGFSRSVTLS